jgi:hypothetical protein
MAAPNLGHAAGFVMHWAMSSFSRRIQSSFTLHLHANLPKFVFAQSKQPRVNQLGGLKKVETLKEARNREVFPS